METTILYLFSTFLPSTSRLFFSWRLFEKDLPLGDSPIWCEIALRSYQKAEMSRSVLSNGKVMEVTNVRHLGNFRFSSSNILKTKKK